MKKLLAANDSIFGEIENPITKINPDASQYESVTSGLPLFISNLLRLITIGAGIFALFNFIAAGLNYITAGGDEQKIQNSWSMILNSIYGLVIIAVSFVLTGVISYILFQDATVILKPTIYGPGGAN